MNGVTIPELSEKTLRASDKMAVRKIFVYRRVKGYWGIWSIR
jgi:hypothetical protein